MGPDIWICLLVWPLSVWATATRKVLFVLYLFFMSSRNYVFDCKYFLRFSISKAYFFYVCVHRKVTAAAEKQMRKLWHTTLIYAYPTLHEYCEKLVSHFPDPLKVRWCILTPLMGMCVHAVVKMYAGLVPCTGGFSDKQRLWSERPRNVYSSSSHWQLWHNHFQVWHFLCFINDAIWTNTVTEQQ